MFARVVRISRLFVFVSWFCSNLVRRVNTKCRRIEAAGNPIFLGRSKETLLAGLEKRAPGHNQFRIPSKLVFDDCIR